jgi:adenylate kinase family enzyme
MVKSFIVLFGAPGAGKGTYGRLLQKHYGYPVFSIGDYFRKIINQEQSDDQFVSNLR